jgi:hypothetical protein
MSVPTPRPPLDVINQSTKTHLQGRVEGFIEEAKAEQIDEDEREAAVASGQATIPLERIQAANDTMGECVFLTFAFVLTLSCLVLLA